MANSYQRILRSLRDIPKVEGSFVLGDAAAVLASDMPSFVDEAILRGVGESVLTLQQNMDEQGDSCHAVTLQYNEHTLYCRRFATGTLCVLAAPDVVPGELNMALAVVGRQLTSLR